jgi:hypothetical protein
MFIFATIHRFSRSLPPFISGTACWFSFFSYCLKSSWLALLFRARPFENARGNILIYFLIYGSHKDWVAEWRRPYYDA